MKLWQDQMFLVDHWGGVTIACIVNFLILTALCKIDKSVQHSLVAKGELLYEAT
jgi:hypothetical protein